MAAYESAAAAIVTSSAGVIPGPMSITYVAVEVVRPVNAAVSLISVTNVSSSLTGSASKTDRTILVVTDVTDSTICTYLAHAGRSNQVSMVAAEVVEARKCPAPFRLVVVIAAMSLSLPRPLSVGLLACGYRVVSTTRNAGAP